MHQRSRWSAQMHKQVAVCKYDSRTSTRGGEGNGCSGAEALTGNVLQRESGGPRS